MQEVPIRELRAREVWWAFVVDGVRSKVGATLPVLGLGLAGTAVCLSVLSIWFVAAAGAHTKTQTPSVAYGMAQINCKCVPSGARITTYRRLLTKLVTRKCKETQLRLASELANMRHILAHDGRATTAISG